MSTNNHRYNTRLSSGKLKRKEYNMRDDDNGTNIDNSDSEDSSDDQSDKQLDKLKYYKLLNQLFPSKFSKEKINSQKKLNDFKFNFHNKDLNDGEKKLYEITKRYIKSKNICKHSNKKSKNQDYDLINHINNIYSNKYYDESDESDDSNNSDDSDNSDNSNDSDDSNDSENNKNIKKYIFEKLKNGLNNNKSNKNINIILNLKHGKNNIYNYDNDNNEDENEENIFEINPKYLKYNDNDDTDDSDYSEKEYHDTEKNNMEITSSDKNEILDDIKPNKKKSNNNYKKFVKIMESEDDKEAEYFKKNMSLKSQIDTISKLEKIKSLTTIEKPYLIHLLELDIPDSYKACALRKLNTLRGMSPGLGNSEYYKIKSWIDAFIKIPFNKYNNLEITFADGIEKCNEFMEHSKQILDDVTYGLEDAKIQIMQMIGLWLVNPNAVGTAIAIKGPPGTGKTTLIKEGISKILNRPFSLIALGGCGDSGFLDGHDYTYEGSKYGKIIDILIQSQCMNPVILFDELDKISDSSRGAEITGVLTHLTDTTQNSKFCDKYMSEITLDMSRALYIFSYNDERLVNPILKDRMYKIETKGYKLKDKNIIANKYLLPKIRDQSKFDENDINISEDILEYIINNFTDKEDGVRNLKRCLEIIYTKLNLYRLMKPETKLFNSENMITKEKINFPLNLTTEIVDKLLIKIDNDKIPFGMYN